MTDTNATMSHCSVIMLSKRRSKVQKRATSELKLRNLTKQHKNTVTSISNSCGKMLQVRSIWTASCKMWHSTRSARWSTAATSTRSCSSALSWARSPLLMSSSRTLLTQRKIKAGLRYKSYATCPNYLDHKHISSCSRFGTRASSFSKSLSRRRSCAGIYRARTILSSTCLKRKMREPTTVLMVINTTMSTSSAWTRQLKRIRISTKVTRLCYQISSSLG